MVIAEAPAGFFVPAPGESWIVCHARPRCEKKFASLLQAEQITYYLPLIDSIRQYGYRTKRFTKPLFLGYVFVRVPMQHHPRIFQQELLVRTIRVDNESRFLRQLTEIEAIVKSGLTVTLRPLLKHGTRVKVIAGPLHGLEGLVETVANPKGIVITVDVLQQGLLVKVPLEHLRLLP